MRFATEHIRNALKATAPAVLVNAQQPHLAAVHLAARDGHLHLRTTDFETWIETRVDATQAEMGEEEWAAPVSHRLLVLVANVARAKEIELRPGRGTVDVRAGRFEWTLPVMAGDLPAWPELADELVRMDAAEFHALVSRVASAASDQPGYSPPLNVAQIVVMAGELRLAATDRHRMHFEAASVADADAVGVIYPEAERLAKVTGTLSGEVTIGVSGLGGLFGLTDGRTVILARSVACEKWIKVADAITKWKGAIGGITTVDAGTFADAIRGVAATLPEDVPVKITATADELTIAGRDEEGGTKGAASVEEFTHTGRGIAAYVNPKYLLPALTVLGDASAQLEWTGPKSAVLVTVPERPGVFAVMPVSLPGAGWITEEAA